MATATVKINDRKLARLPDVIAKGVAVVMAEIAAAASRRAPDRPPEGQGLVDAWGWLVYVDGNVVDSASGTGEAPIKPTDFQPGHGVSGVVGFDRPGRWVEVGTSDTPAEPFFTPASTEIAGRAASIIARETAPLLKRP